MILEPQNDSKFDFGVFFCDFIFEDVCLIVFWSILAFFRRAGPPIRIAYSDTKRTFAMSARRREKVIFGMDFGVVLGAKNR